MTNREPDWKCASCGVPSPKRERVCDCGTSVVYRRRDGCLEHAIKVPNERGRTALERLRQAIIENTKGDMHWLQILLLGEIERETGYGGPPLALGEYAPAEGGSDGK
jgi:hypothetical protein